MKLLTFFLMIPLLVLSSSNSKVFPQERIHPELLVSGMNIKAFNNCFSERKGTKRADGTMMQKLKPNTVDLGSISIEEALVISDSGILIKLSLLLNKTQGAKFRTNIIEKYGMPIGETMDVYAWKINNVIFQIDETKVGFIASYKPIGLLR